MSPTVSVIMNCYNGARYLREAIESVLGQTWQDWEIVFWDNRSEDESAQIFKSYGDSRLRYFLADEHTDLGRARKLAAREARGQWLAFLDCDDVWLPGKLERQLEAGTANPSVGLVYCRAELLVEEGGHVPEDHVFNRFPGKLPSGRIFNTLVRGNFIPLPSMMVRRKALDSIGGFAGKYPIMEDYYVSLNIARHYEVAAIQEALCRYRVHGNNASSSTSTDTFEDLNILRSLYPDPRAMLASGRILARHFRKCVSSRQMPDWAGITRGFGI